MRKLRGKHKSVGSVPLFGNRSLRSVEALEKRVMLAADFEVVSSGNDFWVEANGTTLTVDEADNPVGDTFTLRHISQNEVHIRIDFPVDLDNNGKADSTDFIVGSFDLDFYEFQAALAGKNFIGVKVNAFAGNDTIDAMRLRHHDDGQFEFNGGDGNDLIIGGRRGDIINGGAGNDTIERADNKDVIRGGTGIDSVYYGTHSGPAESEDSPGGAAVDDMPDNDVEYVEGTSFDDNINLSGNPNDVTIIGGAGNDTLTGGNGNDNIDGGAGDDTINGGAGNDTLSGGAGVDTIHGGDGNDSISGGLGDDKLYGDAGNDTIDGDAGNDELHGGIGNDTLRGGDGNDHLLGEEGNDTLRGGAGDDTLDGGADNDDLNGDDGDDTLIGGAGGDIIRGGAGNDTSKYDVDGPAGVIVDLQTGWAGGVGSHAEGDSYPGGTGLGTAAGNNDVENVEGTKHADTLRGDVDANVLRGFAGDDNIIGRDGDDFLYGGDGDDTIGYDLRAPDGDQFVTDSEHTGPNGLRGTHENGNDTIEGGAGNDTIRGGGGDDTIDAGDGDDRVEGDGSYDPNGPGTIAYIPSGTDTISGGGGNDYLYASNRNNPNMGGVAPGIELIDGGAGDDWIYGHAGEDQLFGDMDLDDGGDDHLYGYDGDDELNGGNGNDTLMGGNGRDYLFGGDTGFDTFWLEATGAGFSAELEDRIANAGAGPDLFNIYGVASNDTLGQLTIVNELDNDLYVPIVDIVSDFDSAIDQFDFKGLSEPSIVLKWS